mmetsp:Transcript_31426/g.27784  ORF Transcript_31426/g.27784 Transcript_31426/m.27784 type:complete len:214 (-) Transcript_31426:81-722(-)
MKVASTVEDSTDLVVVEVTCASISRKDSVTVVRIADSPMTPTPPRRVDLTDPAAVVEEESALPGKRESASVARTADSPTRTNLRSEPLDPRATPLATTSKMVSAIVEMVADSLTRLPSRRRMMERVSGSKQAAPRLAVAVAVDVDVDVAAVAAVAAAGDVAVAATPATPFSVASASEARIADSLTRRSRPPLRSHKSKLLEAPRRPLWRWEEQ